MASLRPHVNQPLTTKEEKPPQWNNGSDVAPTAVPAGVIFKVLAFTMAMIGAPIGFFFLAINTIFRGNATFAGAGAAVIANVVLIAYIVVAWREDQEDIAAKQRSKEKKVQ